MSEPIWPIGLSEASTEDQICGARNNLAIRPSVVQNSPNDPIPIYAGEIDISVDDRTIRDSGIVRFEFLPSAFVGMEIPHPTDIYGHTAHDDVTAQPLGSDSPVPALLTNSSFTLSRSESSEIGPTSGILQGLLSFGYESRIGRVRFHLLNFLDYRGERIHTRTKTGHSVRLGRTKFDMGPWRITLDALPDARNRLAEANKVKGYVITHVGNLERRGDGDRLGSLFSAADAEKAFEVLYHVFSFANGSRCGCILPYGYRHMPTEVARWIRSDWTAPAQRNGTWFASENPSGSFAFANKLFELWKNEDERGWLSTAIKLYAEANRNLSGVDIELAKSQIALEQLSWEVAQERQQLVSLDGFERMAASDRIRLALMWAGIPTSIPSDMTDLTGVIPKLKDGVLGPYDGPFAITEMRNSTIHTTRKKRKRMAAVNDIARFEAWQLSQSYVALLILRLLDYSGPYMPRQTVMKQGPGPVFQGQPRLWSMVPWAN